VGDKITPTSNIVLIGEGVWGKKVQRVLSDNSDRVVGQFSARSIVSGNVSIPKHFQDNCIFWIATSPELQIKTLSEIGNFAQKIILEKPIANNAKQFIDLENELDKVQCKLFISEVWSHSVLWETLLIIIKKESHNIKKIVIKRFGEAPHSHIHPPLDWITHDINLLYRLGKSLGSRLELKKVDWGQELQQISIEAGLPSYFSVDLKGGKSENGREAIWNLYGEKGLILSANFLKNSISTELESICPVIHTSVEHPIISYLDCVEASDHCQVEEEQLNLHGYLVKEV